MGKSRKTTAIVKIDFHGDELNGWTNEVTQTHYVVLRHIVDAFGLGWSSELKKIQNHPVLSKALGCVELNTPGGIQKVYGLHIDRVAFWLGTISPNRVKDERLHAKLLEYQEECADVLAQHFAQQQGIVSASVAPTASALIDLDVLGAIVEHLKDNKKQLVAHNSRLEALESDHPPEGKLTVHDWLYINQKAWAGKDLRKQLNARCRKLEQPEPYTPKGVLHAWWYYSPKTIEDAWAYVTRQMSFLRDPGVAYQAKKKRKRG